MNKKLLLITLISFLSTPYLTAQEDEWGEDAGPVKATMFSDTRVINGHSSETLEKGQWDLRITHRFGNIAVPNSGRSLFGLDNSTDIRIAMEYGITDDLTIGFGRSKGFAPYSQYWDGLAKYAILRQSDKMPLSLTLATSAFATSMIASTDASSVTSFTKTAHRFSYYSQLILAKNLFGKVTLQLAPGILYRNYVAFEDQNMNVTLGGMIRYNFYKKLSFLVEYYQIFRENEIINNTEYQNPFGVGLEIKTHAHVFQLNFMNSEGIGEGQFIPYTFGKWSEGQFRFGFTISRHF
jgi:hypothetical protein